VVHAPLDAADDALPWPELPLGDFPQEAAVRRPGIFLPIFALLLFAAPLAAGEDKSRIMALENSWNQAELHNEAHAVDMLLADDSVMTVADGYTMNKAQTLASVRDTSYRPDVLQSEDRTVHMYGNTAIVTGTFLEKGKDKGKPFERRGLFTDTWVSFSGQWRCVASHFSAKPQPAH